MLRSIDPATGRELATFPEADEAAVEAAIAKAWDVRHGWRDAGIEHRSQMIRAVAGVLRADKARYASILTAEMGKPIVEAEGEVEKCAWTAGWIADNAARLLADRAHRKHRVEELRPLPAARRRARGHAVELPVLAGVPRAACRRWPRAT